MFTDRGPRSVDERDVLAIYRGEQMGGYVGATLVLASGDEVSGCCLVAAIDRIESELANSLLPPEAA